MARTHDVLRHALITLAVLVAAAAAIALGSASASDDEQADGGDVRHQAKVVRELPELRTETSKTFSTTAGTNLTQVHSQPVNYRAGGEWHAIDNNLVDDPTPGYALTNKAAGYDLALPDAAGGPVAITDGTDRVTFSLDGARGGPRAKGAGATYADALPGVDVTYEAQGDAVKESLVLSSVAAGSKFSFDVATSDGLRARENSSGGIDFVRDGEVRMSFAPPFMEDSSPGRARSDKVAFDLRESDSGYRLVLRADASWLRDADRVYPVTVDPTTYIDTNDDCYMASATSANQSYCGYTDPTMYVGLDGSGAVNRSFMRVDTSAVPKTAEILEGELQLYVNSGSQRNVDLHRVTRESTSARTWNKYDGTNSWTTAGGDISSSPDGSNSTFGGSAGVHRINARKLVQGWVDGSISNYGLIVKDNGTTSGVLNIVNDAASNDPMMEIVWVNRTGEQDRWTFADQKLSDRMALKTNVANGNLILKENDISIPGVGGHDLSYSRSFNNLEFDTSSSTDDLGQYWRGSAGYDVWLSPNGLGTTQAFNGPGDFWAPYDRKSDGTYETPTGMNADLKKNTDGTFKLTYRQSDRKLNFGTTGQLQSEEDRNGNKISYTYSGTNGRMSAIKDSHDQGTTNNTLTFTYTSAGYVDTITDRSSPARVWDYNYTGAKLTSYVNPEGDTTSYSYDANDNLYEVTDPRGTKTRFTYDTQHRVTEIWRDQVNNGPKTKYEYPTTVSSQCTDNGDANDPMDDVVGETIEKDPLWTTGTAHTTKYCWDRLQRVRKTFDGRGESRSKKYTSNSDVTTIDSMGTQAWNLSFDDQRAKEASAPAASGQSSGLKMTYGYPNDSGDPNARSNPLHWLPSSLTDTQNKTTEYTRDSKGNVTEVKLPLTGTPKIAIGVNSNGTTSSITDANLNVTSYTYEGDGDLDTIDRPSSLLTETMDYDNVHRLTSHANANMPSVTETYGYDKLDRMTSIAFNAANSVTYGYDDNGNMTSRGDATGSSTYTYDRLNRLTQESLPGSRTNTYTYDAASNLKTLVDAGGTTTYNYGNSNLLDSMQAPGESAATTFTYNKDAQRTKTTYPNGVALTLDYEDKTDTSGNPDSSDTGPNRLKSIEAKKTSTNTVLTKFSYGYTPDTTLCGGTNADTTLRHQVTNKDNVTSKYCYDPLNRMTKASNHNGSTYDYTLDPVGNITKLVKGASTTSMGYDSANRMCWRVGNSQASAACTPTPSGATTYVYDTSGNLDTSSAGLNLDYNSKGQTTSMTNMSGAGATTMSYAGSNPFERFTAGGATFTNNALGVGAETTGTATTYYRRDNQGGLISQRLPSTGNPIYYYAFDGLGSVSALTDSTGAAPQRYEYDPYGETTPNPSSGGVPNPWRYTSAYQDPTGFYKMGMRYYRPELMRWTQQDSVEQPTDPVNANRYGYAGGNPINAADPAGTTPCYGGDTRFNVTGQHQHMHCQWLRVRAVKHGMPGRGRIPFRVTPRDVGCGVAGAAAGIVGNAWSEAGGVASGFVVGLGCAGAGR